MARRCLAMRRFPPTSCWPGSLEISERPRNFGAPAQYEFPVGYFGELVYRSQYRPAKLLLASTGADVGGAPGVAWSDYVRNTGVLRDMALL